MTVVQLRFLTVPLCHWGQVTHICICKLGHHWLRYGLSPDQHQAIIWTNNWILLTWFLGPNFSVILFKYYTFSFKKMHLKMSSGKWRPFCLGLNELNEIHLHGLVQERRNSIANTLELRLSCTNPSILSYPSGGLPWYCRHFQYCSWAPCTLIILSTALQTGILILH